MATARSSKGQRKGPPSENTAARNSPSRTPNAWAAGARQSPTFSPSPGVRPQQQQQQPATTPATNSTINTSPSSTAVPATTSSTTPTTTTTTTSASASPAAPQLTTFSPLASQTHTPSQSMSQLNGQASGSAPRDKVLQALSGLTGTTITLVAKSGQRYEGVVGSIAGDGDTGLALKDVKDITTPGAPLRDSIFIAATNIESYTSGPADARPANANGDSFRTDMDISQKKPSLGPGQAQGPHRERDLQAWVPSLTDGNLSATRGLTGGDDDTFGPSATNGPTSWDQFSVNEQLFGVRASFDEDVYTTKLDRSAPDFKERERKAQKIANEIIGAVTNNPHIAEERGIVVDDSGSNEEDKYGAVVRSQNAYVPPGARKALLGQTSLAGVSPPASSTSATTDPSTNNIPPVNSTAANAGTTATEIPNVSLNGPEAQTQTQPQVLKAASPAPKPPADPIPAFRDFVVNERQRLTQKRAALVKSDMDKRMADLLKFSQSFKLNKPIPEDLVPILAKDQERQQQIMEKAKEDATSAQARVIGPSTPAAASRGVGLPSGKVGERKGTGGSGSSKGAVKESASGSAIAAMAAAATQKTANAIASSSSSSTSKTLAFAGEPSSSASTPALSGSGNGSGTGLKKIPMVIQAIPPYKGESKVKTPASAAPAGAGSGTTSASGGGGSGSGSGSSAMPSSASAKVGGLSGKGQGSGHGSSQRQAQSQAHRSGNQHGQGSQNQSQAAAAAANRLNVNASSFRPNPKVSPSSKTGPATHLSGPMSNAVSPKSKPDSTAPNPFFGTRVINKNTVNVKDDFNPFKLNKVVEASQITATWPYNGKRYMVMFPQPPPQHAAPAPHPGHMAGPPMGMVIPPPLPPPSYEEDSAAQAAAAAQQPRYVYTYPPYGAYPPQHMMQGMAPPGGPPGTYMPGPFMQPIPYAPGMPPPNTMYSPAIGQMPPTAYMQPHPGPYPPPNGAGPRPSMPPTPIPAHAHPYYHQSPQLQHAYPMMMHPPPPNIPPQHGGYEGGPAPPVQMGGHA